MFNSLVGKWVVDDVFVFVKGIELYFVWFFRQVLSYVWIWWKVLGEFGVG